jgi:hypothetical protein
MTSIAAHIGGRNCPWSHCCQKMDSIGRQKKTGLALEEETKKGDYRARSFATEFPVRTAQFAGDIGGG